MILIFPIHTNQIVGTYKNSFLFLIKRKKRFFFFVLYIIIIIVVILLCIFQLQQKKEACIRIYDQTLCMVCVCVLEREGENVCVDVCNMLFVWDRNAF